MRTVLLALLSFALARPVTAQWTAPPDDSLRALLAERVERGGSTGLILGVIDGGRPRVVAVGYRDGPDSPTLDAETEVEIGSVSKVLTATLLGEMVARGEVSLDDPIQQFLPDSVTAPSFEGTPITLLDLATQTSGLPRLPTNLEVGDASNPYASYDAGKLYAFLSSYRLTRKPGAGYEYSNLGVGLLGHLLARRLGLSYEQAVTERVLRPLGMTDTRLELTPSQRERLARGHGADLEPVQNWDFAVLAGAGGWRSTATDMLRFLGAQMSPPAGSLGKGITLATTARRATSSPAAQIGLAWQVLVRGDDRVIWHNGQTAGYHSFIGFRPSTGANVLVLSTSAIDIDDLGIHVLDPSIPVRHLPVAITLPRDSLAAFVGRYQLAPSFAIEVTLRGDALYAQATGQPAFRLFPSSPTRFFLRGVPAEIGFSRDSTGAVSKLVLYQGGRETPGQRVK